MLVPPPRPLDGPFLPAAPWTEVEWHDEIDSTNAEVLRRASAGASEGLVVGADVQTAGRGRRGRSWHAPPGSSLLVSVLLRPTLPSAMWPLLPLVAGVALDRAATTLCPAAPIGLKWPNDLLIGGTKAAGILVESVTGAVVVGIGLNVDWRDVARPPGIEATSLAEAAPAPVGRGEALEALLDALGVEYAAAQVDPSGVVQRYAPRCVTIGRRVVAHGVAGAEGVAVGLGAGGELRIRTDADRVIEVASGEVAHLRSADDPLAEGR